MLKSELIEILAKRTKLSASDTALCLDTLLGVISETIAQGHRVEIRGFGVFGRRERAARRARNPMTGERVDVPAKAGSYFKAGKELAARVDTITKKPDEGH
jgi:integration host factor subunit beta